MLTSITSCLILSCFSHTDTYSPWELAEATSLFSQILMRSIHWFCWTLACRSIIATNGRANHRPIMSCFFYHEPGMIEADREWSRWEGLVARSKLSRDTSKLGSWSSMIASRLPLNSQSLVVSWDVVFIHQWKYCQICIDTMIALWTDYFLAAVLR